MKTFKKWLKRIGIGLALLIGIALIAGIIYEQYGRSKIRKYEETRTGKMIDVGGHSLYCYAKGEGGPTVVFEPGFPGTHLNWIYGDVFKELSEHTTVVAYNRAGQLWSERGENEKSAENISMELHQMLENGGFEKPYILIGHSIAGIYLRPFAHDYPEDILGIILLDPSHPNQMVDCPEELQGILKPPFIPTEWMLDVGNNIGLLRFLSGDDWLFYSIQSGGIYDELMYMVSFFDRKSTLPSFGDVPLLVISAGSEEGIKNYVEDEDLAKKMLEYWNGLQQDVANSSSKGRRIISKNSSHNDIMRVEKDLIVAEALALIQPEDSLRSHE